MYNENDNKNDNKNYNNSYQNNNTSYENKSFYENDDIYDSNEYENNNTAYESDESMYKNKDYQRLEHTYANEGMKDEYKSNNNNSTRKLVIFLSPIAALFVIMISLLIHDEYKIHKTKKQIEEYKSEVTKQIDNMNENTSSKDFQENIDKINKDFSDLTNHQGD